MSIAAVAEKLLAMLHAPMKLEWETSLEDGSSGAKARVIVSVNLNAEATSWPPKKFNVRVIRGNAAEDSLNLLHTYGLEVASSISSLQFSELLNAGLNTAEHPPVKGPLVDLPKLYSDECRGLSQPACLQQWNHNICGHHALYNIQCLLNDEAGLLQNSQHFWHHTLRNIQVLAKHGEDSKRWPASRVTKGVADGVHLRHLIESSESLRGKVSIAQTAESFTNQLEASDSTMSRAIEDVRQGRTQAHGFLLGATNHWYSAVMMANPSKDAALCAEGYVAPAGKAAVQLLFFDSYNRQTAHLQSAQDVEQYVKEWKETRRTHFFAKLRSLPEWEHRPQEHLDLAFEEGLPEWWKGIHKAASFWREPPLEVQRQLKILELDNVRSYLSSLVHALGFSKEEFKFRPAFKE